ncbi:MAG TPA: OmpH family outer membrane protein [Bryobacteraceae bacterium]|jgi:outer membrane protein|nr:OmpH family outer membrane protein [Bryobacteraceae bacterium]
MMKVKPLIPIACLLATFALSMNGQTTVKVGVLNVEKALGGTAEGQKATLAISARIGPQQKEFDARQQELSTLNDQLTKGASLLSEDKKAELAREIESKKKRLERDMQDADESLRADQQKLLQQIGQRLTAVVNQYAKANGYTLILEEGGASGSVIYAAPSIDVTDDVIKLYDKTYPAAGSPKP